MSTSDHDEVDRSFVRNREQNDRAASPALALLSLSLALCSPFSPACLPLVSPFSPACLPLVSRLSPACLLLLSRLSPA
eukprot:344475-Hanusia_phi.AAC.4